MFCFMLVTRRERQGDTREGEDILAMDSLNSSPLGGEGEDMVFRDGQWVERES